MMISYRRLYANDRLDSRIHETMLAQGKIKNSLLYTLPNRSEFVTGFFLLPDFKAVILLAQSIILYDLLVKKVAITARINEFSPVVIDASGTIYYTDYFLQRSTFTDFSSNNLYYPIPGNPGAYSAMQSLYPFKDYYITCVHHSNTPKFARSKMLVASSVYEKNSKYIWAHEFQGKIPPPPITNSGQLIICEKNIIHIIDIQKGNTTKSVEFDQAPVFCSADIHDNLYFLSLADSGSILRKTSSLLEILWEQHIDMRTFAQPPIISDKEIVYVLGVRRLEAFNQNGMLWDFVRTGSEKSPFIATLSGNEKLLIIDGSRLLCIDENGKIEWGVQHPTGGIFRTQPFCDEKGNIWVADDKAIFAIE